MYVHTLHGAPLYITISSIWKSPDKFRSHTLQTWEKQKKSERESSFIFVFIVDDRYALFLTPNAYSDVLMRIFTPCNVNSNTLWSVAELVLTPPFSKMSPIFILARAYK